MSLLIARISYSMLEWSNLQDVCRTSHFSWSQQRPPSFTCVLVATIWSLEPRSVQQTSVLRDLGFLWTFRFKMSFSVRAPSVLSAWLTCRHFRIASAEGPGACKATACASGNFQYWQSGCCSNLWRYIASILYCSSRGFYSHVSYQYSRLP